MVCLVYMSNLTIGKSLHQHSSINHASNDCIPPFNFCFPLCFVLSVCFFFSVRFPNRSQPQYCLLGYPGAIMTDQQHLDMQKLYHIPTAVKLSDQFTNASGDNTGWVLVGDPMEVGTMVNDPKGTGKQG